MDSKLFIPNEERAEYHDHYKSEMEHILSDIYSEVKNIREGAFKALEAFSDGGFRNGEHLNEHIVLRGKAFVLVREWRSKIGAMLDLLNEWDEKFKEEDHI